KHVFNPSALPLVKAAKSATSILLFMGLGVVKAFAGQKAGKAASTAKSGAAGQRMAPARPPSGPTPRTPSPPRWRQPALPGIGPRPSAGSGPAAPTQRPVPGIDSRTDQGAPPRLLEPST